MSTSNANAASSAAARLQSESPVRTVTSGPWPLLVPRAGAGRRRADQARRRAAAASIWGSAGGPAARCGDGPGGRAAGGGKERSAGSWYCAVGRGPASGSTRPSAAVPGEGPGPGRAGGVAAVASCAVMSWSPTAARARRRMKPGLNLPAAAAARVLPPRSRRAAATAISRDATHQVMTMRPARLAADSELVFKRQGLLPQGRGPPALHEAVSRGPPGGSPAAGSAWGNGRVRVQEAVPGPGGRGFGRDHEAASALSLNTRTFKPTVGDAV